MIKDLDDTLKVLLTTKAPPNSMLANAVINFDLPDSDWRTHVSALTLNLYLYDIRQNPGMRTSEQLVVRSDDATRVMRIAPPARIDCAYCITAWSIAGAGAAVFEEHRLLSQALRVLLQNTTIPPELLQGGLSPQFAPYLGIVGAQDGGKNMPDFWNALDQKLKPSLNYIVTMSMLTEDIPTDQEIPFGLAGAKIETKPLL